MESIQGKVAAMGKPALATNAGAKSKAKKAGLGRSPHVRESVCQLLPVLCQEVSVEDQEKKDFNKDLQATLLSILIGCFWGLYMLTSHVSY